MVLKLPALCVEALARTLYHNVLGISLRLSLITCLPNPDFIMFRDQTRFLKVAHCEYCLSCSIIDVKFIQSSTVY